MDWRVKGLVQLLLSTIPGGHAINNFMQRHLGGLRQFEACVDSKIRDDWFVFVDHLHTLSRPIENRTFLEIGTGWFPTLPICFYLAGASDCITYDLNRLLHFGRTLRMLNRLEIHLEEIAERSGSSISAVQKRWSNLLSASDLDDLLRRAKIVYRAPADASSTDLATASIDVVFSNSVLEHVAYSDLLPLMKEARRILKSDGVALHSVDCGDHYSYFDRSILPINFLRFDDRQWKIWNTDLQYQNRIRAPDFIDIAKSAGFRIVLDYQRPRADLLEVIERFPVAEKFRHYTKEQLCTTSVDFAGVTGE